MSHIESLAGGTKISVRGLSAELNVSEGTVYKAIKEAEMRGLVITKPKSGTFRVEAQTGGDIDLSLTDIISALGTSCVAGKRSMARNIKKLLLCDSDEEQLERELEGSDSSQTLCIVGNRADLQTIIVQSGANLIITGGYRPNDYLIAKAEHSGSCILCAPQNTYAVLRLLESFFSGSAFDSEAGKISQWMQIPSFLYKDDLAADWYRFYTDNFHGFSGFPIVDDERSIYGNIDVIQSFSVPHSQKLVTLVSDDVQTLSADADTPMQELARRMILSGSPYAAIVNDGHMEGMIYYTDLLRYFMFSSSSGRVTDPGSKFTFEPELSTEDRRVYSVELAPDELPAAASMFVTLSMAAARKHIAQIDIEDYVPVNCSIAFIAVSDVQCSFSLSTVLLNGPGGTVNVDVEIYTEEKLLARATYVFAKKA